jgi:hypothetical protein
MERSASYSSETSVSAYKPIRCYSSEGDGVNSLYSGNINIYTNNRVFCQREVPFVMARNEIV